MPPVWLLHVAVAAVWSYEGLWCKLLGGDETQLEIVRAVPLLGVRVGTLFLLALGVLELAIAVWVLSGAASVACAVVQTALLVALNTNVVLWGRHVIHDRGGMIVRNVAFLVLAWVGASRS